MMVVRLEQDKMCSDIMLVQMVVFLLFFIKKRLMLLKPFFQLELGRVLDQRASGARQNDLTECES